MIVVRSCSTTCSLSAYPGSAPDAAARSSPAPETLPACSDESVAAADPVAAVKASRSAENHSSTATPECALHPGDPSSVSSPGWLGSGLHLLSRPRVPVLPAYPQTSD